MGTDERGMGSIRAEHLPMTVVRLACEGFATEECDFTFLFGRRGDLRTSCWPAAAHIVHTMAGE
eukprot:6091719-Prymnesium_polylepis.1